VPLLTVSPTAISEIQQLGTAWFFMEALKRQLGQKNGKMKNYIKKIKKLFFF